MALVDYASSEDDTPAIDEDEDESNTTAVASSSLSTSTLKRKRVDEVDLPPLPSHFHDLYATGVRVGTRDDPSLHDGRVRVTPHVEGNWPTHLFIEWYPPIAASSLIKDLIARVSRDVRGRATVHTFLTNELGAALPLHISLSRPIGFATEVKDDVLVAVQRAIANSHIRPFAVHLTDLSWVANFERTRWFLVLRTGKPQRDELNVLLRTCNAVVEEYSQPPLYAESHIASLPKKASSFASRNPHQHHRPVTFPTDYSDHFHVSIGWTLQEPDSDAVDRIGDVVKSKSFHELVGVEFLVKEIKVKIGNVVTTVELASKVGHDRGSIGF